MPMHPRPSASTAKVKPVLISPRREVSSSSEMEPRHVSPGLHRERLSTRRFPRDRLQMLRRLIPLKGRGLPRCRKIRDTHLDACFCQELRPEGGYRETCSRANSHAIVVGDRGVFPIAQVAPVRVAEKSIIPSIATDPAGIGTGQPIRRGKGAPPLRLMVMSPASHFQPAIIPTPDTVVPLPGISRTPVGWACARDGTRTISPRQRRSRKGVSIFS